MKSTPSEVSAEDSKAAVLISGGCIINEDGLSRCDVLVKGGKIVQVGNNIQHPEAQVINAEGKYIIPGGIDPHTHFGFKSVDGIQSVDSFASGTKAALAGGTTTVVNCVQFDGKGLVSSFQKWKAEAESQAHCNFALCVTVPDFTDATATEMTELAKMHGVNAFKLSTAYKDAPMLDDTKLYKAMKQCRDVGALARLHAEHGDLIALKEDELLASKQTLSAEDFLSVRPESLEADCVSKASSISLMANCPLDVVYALNSEVCDSVSKARRKGQIVFAETTVAALATDGGSYFHHDWSHAVAHLTSPPLRPDPRLKEMLIERLSCDDVQMTASGHCAYNTEQRSAYGQSFFRLPSGTVGAEERMMLLWTLGVNSGKMDPMRFVAVTSSNAAKIFNIYPKKGRIAVDSDADLVIWDPEAEKSISVNSHHSLADHSIFEGLRCTGIPMVTMVAGEVVFESGQVKNTAGCGAFTPLAAFSPYVFSRLLLAKGGGWKHSAQATYASLSSNVIYQNKNSDACNEFHARPATKAGTRNLLDSSFALSGAQVDDSQTAKRLTRITKPPGGESHPLW